jgi:hypothetical protein
VSGYPACPVTWGQPVSVNEDNDREQIETIQLQRFLTTTAKPFPYLKRLDLFLENGAVALFPRWFPAVTWLRLEAYSPRTDESALKSIASMSQLQILRDRRGRK